jgi:general secretion pathway protein C
MPRLLPFVETLLRRYPWLITLVALIPCAYFAARGTSELAAAQYLPTDAEALSRALPTPGARSNEASATTQNRHVRDRAAMIHRNIFDSDGGCLDCPDAPPVDPDAATANANPLDDRILPPEVCERDRAMIGQPHPGPCSSQAKIMGAVVSEHDEWSFAFVAVQPGGPSMPFRQGQQLEGNTVSLVGHCPAVGSYILLRPASGPRCFLAQIMPAAPAAPPPPVAVAAPPPGPAPTGALAAALEGIERSGPNEFNVRRSTVDRILESQAELMRTTRIMPHEEGGRVVGVQLFGVRGNSLLGRLGMQNGDVLNRINGLEIASPDRALEAYSRLRTSDHLTISVTRNGQPVNIDFNIR